MCVFCYFCDGDFCDGDDYPSLFLYLETALIVAAKEGHTAVVKLLLATSGIDVNARSHDTIGEYHTALIVAAEKGDIAVVKLLLAAPGIDVNATREDEARRLALRNRGRGVRTALMQAAKKGHTAVVKLLLAAPGIDVNGEYHPPLIVAAKKGHTAVVRAIERFIAGQAMNRWIPRHRSRQRDRVGLSELDREGTPFMDLVYYTTQGFL
jgi:ankyrin repeat protein